MKIFKSIIEIEKNNYYPLTIFIVNIIFWNLLFSSMLTSHQIGMLFILSTASIYSLLRIIKKIPHRQIPNDYPEWAQILLRIMIFLFFLFFLLNSMYDYEILQV